MNQAVEESRCRVISYGIESMNKDELGITKKQMTTDLTVKALD